jgi:hypothetical protein
MLLGIHVSTLLCRYNRRRPEDELQRLEGMVHQKEQEREALKGACLLQINVRPHETRKSALYLVRFNFKVGESMWQITCDRGGAQYDAAKYARCH